MSLIGRAELTAWPAAPSAGGVAERIMLAALYASISPTYLRGEPTCGVIKSLDRASARNSVMLAIGVHWHSAPVHVSENMYKRRRPAPAERNSKCAARAHLYGAEAVENVRLDRARAIMPPARHHRRYRRALGPSTGARWAGGRRCHRECADARAQKR